MNNTLLEHSVRLLNNIVSSIWQSNYEYYDCFMKAIKKSFSEQKSQTKNIELY